VLSLANALILVGASIALLSIQLGYFVLIPAGLMIWTGILLKQQRKPSQTLAAEKDSCSSAEPSSLRKRRFGSIILAGFLASSCCTVPVIVILAIGAGSAAFAVSFIQYAPEFLAVGIIFLLAMLLYNIKKMNRGRLNMEAIKKERHLILKSLLVLGVVWGVITYGIAPVVAGSVYNTALQTTTLTSTLSESSTVTESSKVARSIVPLAPGDEAQDQSGQDSDKQNIESQASDSSSQTSQSNFRLLRLKIDGMYCSSCVYSEQVTLGSLRGVLKVNVWLGGFFSPSGAEVVYDSSQISAEEIRRAATYYVFKATIENDTPIQ